jgi:phenylacetate-CoA ligase
MSQTHATTDYFDPVVETMPRDQIERLQEAALLQLLPYVYQRSALTQAIWKEAGVHPRDIRSLADFREKAPFINKDTIRNFRDQHNDPCGGLLCVTPPHLRGVGFTSGTTGDPTPVPRPLESLSIRHLKRDLWHIGARPGDSFIYQLFTFREGFNADMWQDTGFRPIHLQHSPDEIGMMVEAARRFRPTVFFMLSTPLILAIDGYLRTTGTDPRDVFASFHGAVFGGEPLSPHHKALVESWGLEIFDYTSLGDVTGAMECSAHAGMHTWEDAVLVEHLDPTGNDPAGNGQRGELVITALMDDVAPLVRYRSDDLILFDRERCSCGRTHGRMTPLGRKGDEILVQGRSVLPRDLMPIVQGNGETVAGLFQIVLTSREVDCLRLRVGFDAALTTSQTELAGRLAEQIRAALGIAVDIELRDNEELLKLGPPQKIPRVTKV